MHTSPSLPMLLPSVTAISFGNEWAMAWHQTHSCTRTKTRWTARSLSSMLLCHWWVILKRKAVQLGQQDKEMESVGTTTTAWEVTTRRAQDPYGGRDEWRQKHLAGRDTRTWWCVVLPHFQIHWTTVFSSHFRKIPHISKHIANSYYYSIGSKAPSNWQCWLDHSQQSAFYFFSFLFIFFTFIYFLLILFIYFFIFCFHYILQSIICCILTCLI